MPEDATLGTGELIETGRDLLAHLGDEAESLRVKVARMVDLSHPALVFGLAQHTLRLGRVVLDLYEQGLRLEAMPLVRVAFESAITASWMADSREATHAFHNEEFRQRRNLANTMARSANEVFVEGAKEFKYLDAEDLETAANPQARNFERLCESLVGGRSAYGIYRAMSAYTHPSVMLADHYVVAHENSEVKVRLRNEPEQIDHDSWLYLTVASMMWAARALDVMQEDSPNRSYLRGVARRLKSRDVLRLTDEARASEAKAEQQRRRAQWRGRRPRRRTGD